MTSQPAWQSKRTLLIGGVAAVVVLILGIGGFFLLSGEPAPSPTPSPSEASSPTPIPTEEALNRQLLNNRLTVLFVGLDSNEARRSRGETLNTDALLLLSISARQSELTLVSLPRDTVDLPRPDGTVWPRKINALYAAEGIEALTDTLAETYQVEVHGHLVLDMDDFAAIVDAVDGITVDPPQPLSDPPIGLNLAAGEQEIDGLTTLAYVRTRIDQDYGRMGRQQEVIQQIAAELADPDTDVDLPELLGGLDSLETDLPLDELRTFVEIARRAQDAEVTEILIQPPLITFEGDAGDGRGYILVPDVDAIRARVAEAMGSD